MVPEPRNDIGDMPQLRWNNWTECTVEANVLSVNRTDIPHATTYYNYSIHMVIVGLVIFIDPCGMMGNGIVIWLLGFCMKRSHYGLYLLNLAIADFTYLFSNFIEIICILSKYSPSLIFEFASIVATSAYLMGLSLLMVVSTERCVSVLWPIWYKCHRPAYLSTILCTLFWVLSSTFSLVIFVCKYLKVTERFTMWSFPNSMSFITFVVLFVSSLVLVIRVHCYSRQRQPSKLYWSILLNVLAFLLLSVPRSVYVSSNLSANFNSLIWTFLILLSVTSSALNPIIYFFVGRHGHRQYRKPLREVLQNALRDEDEETEQITENITSGEKITYSKFQEQVLC